MKLKFLIFFLLISTEALTQNLSMAELLTIRKHNLASAEELLSRKGWEISETIAADKDNLAMISFSFKKAQKSALATSFLTYFVSNSKVENNRVFIQIHQISKYNEYIDEIKSYGSKLITSNIENGKLIKVYKGKTTTFEIQSGKGSNDYTNDKSIWFLTIYSNEDYLVNFEKSGIPIIDSDNSALGSYYESDPGVMDFEELKSKYNYVTQDTKYSYSIKVISTYYDKKHSQIETDIYLRILDHNSKSKTLKLRTFWGRKGSSYLILPLDTADNHEKTYQEKLSDEVMETIDHYLTYNLQHG